VELPAQALRDATLGEAIAAHGAGPLPPFEHPAGAHLLIAGSAWMQNRRYAEASSPSPRRGAFGSPR
jgi:hypothetical protein